MGWPKMNYPLVLTFAEAIAALAADGEGLLAAFHRCTSLKATAARRSSERGAVVPAPGL